jgi:hypothetical protein
VSISTLSLCLLITLRLLMPPGICVCKLSSPASRLLLAVCGQEVPEPNSPDEDRDDDHHPGCPASFLSVGMGVAPPSGPGQIDLPLTGVVEAESAPLFQSASDLLPLTCSVLDSVAPLYVAHCALLV